jgi:hypothetical protein
MYHLIEEHEEELRESEIQYSMATGLMQTVDSRQQTEAAQSTSKQVQMANTYTWQGETQLEMG